MKNKRSLIIKIAAAVAAVLIGVGVYVYNVDSRLTRLEVLEGVKPK